MNWFRNLKTLNKLMLVFGLMAVVLAFVGYQGISASSTIKGKLNSLYERDMVGSMVVKQAAMDRVMLARDLYAVHLASDSAQKQEKARSVEKDLSSLREDLTAVEKTLHTDEGRTRMARIKELFPQYEPMVAETLRLALSNNNEESLAVQARAAVIGEQFTRELQALADLKDQQARQAYTDSNAIESSLRTTLIAILCCSVLLALGVGYFIARLIGKPLDSAVEVLDKVAKGDLTARLEVDTKDEIGQMAVALNAATAAMREALSEVNQSANSMASAAQELASASEELASGAQEQASSLEETTATLEQITSTVKQNADNAKQANQVACGSRDTAEKGGQVVTEAVAAMGEINQASKNIADIITAIDEIAFQTNLLALNAAVEAARAGEQGRGFAVVATEVRNLAQRSATSAKEIKRLIQDSVRKVENGSSLVNRSGETLQEIVNSVKRVTDIVGEIAAASREQSTGIEQVNKAMVQMDQVTQTNSSQTEELSSTAQSLATHAQQLQALVQRFRLDDGRGQSHTVIAVPASVARPVSNHQELQASTLRPHRSLLHAAAASTTGTKPNGSVPAEATAFVEF